MGVDKADFFLRNSKRFRPDESGEERLRRRRGVVKAWAAEGLKLKDMYGSMGGRVGNSFDAQRLILLAREQKKENVCIEAIYEANHEEGRCLCKRDVLLDIAERAGVIGAAAMLDSDRGKDDVAARIKMWTDLGVNAVPMVVFNKRISIGGYPDVGLLRKMFSQLLA